MPYTDAVLWEMIFMLVVLKIPVVYLCCVIYWAIKAEPRPLEGATLPAVVEPPGSGTGWRRRTARPPRRRGPHGAPVRGYPRTRRAVLARAAARR